MGRDDEAGPEEAEIAVAERRDERGAAGFGGTGLVERAFDLQLGSEALFCHLSSLREIPLRECMGVEPTTERNAPRQRF